MVSEEENGLKERMLAGNYKQLKMFKRKAETLKSAFALEKNIAKVNLAMTESKEQEARYQTIVDKCQFYQEELLRVKEEMELQYKIKLGLISVDDDGNPILDEEKESEDDDVSDDKLDLLDSSISEGDEQTYAGAEEEEEDEEDE